MKFYILTALLFFSLFYSYAQAPALKIRYFSKNDGLNSSFINHVAQDSTGFLWAGTRDGLYKYNGYGFSAYYHKLEDTTTLIYNNISYLYVDSKKRLWVGTTLGLCLYNEKKDNFIRIVEEKDNAGLSSLVIVQITEDADKNILVNTGNGVFMLNEKSFRFSQVIKSSSQINYIITGKDYWWLAKNKGLVRYNPETSEEKIVVPNLNIIKIASDNDRLWITSLGLGVMAYFPATNQLQRFPYSNTDDAMAFNVMVDQSDNIWTVDFTGLKYVNKSEGTLTGFYPQILDPFSLKPNLKGVFQDKQGNYWFYHEPGGLGVSIRMKGFHHFNNSDGAPWLTSSNNITSIHEDQDGSLWIGHHEGGVDIFRWNTGKTIHFSNNSLDNYSIGRGTVLCMFRDSRNVMWIGTYLGGLQYFDEKNNRFITYKHDPSDPFSLAGNDIRSIAEDAEGNLWLAIHSKGVDKFNIKTGKAVHYNNANSKLSNDWPFQVLIDHHDDLWVATAWGLSKLKKGEKRFTAFLSDPQDTNSLVNNVVTTLYEDSNHVLWVGTTAGLDRFNAETNNFTRYADLFESNFITGILTDDDMNLWISTLAGISKLDPVTRKVNNFNMSDGLISNEYNIRSLYRNNKNELFFGGTGGLDVFNPDKLSMNTLPPTVIIDKILIFNHDLTADYAEDHTDHISSTEKITLSYTDKIITLHFKALNFINPDRNKYAYKLVGFDKKWHYAGDIKEATYTNLNPGRYVFRVIASNNDDVWNTKGASLQIIISPPWYGTMAFKILAALVMIALIFYYIHFRTSKLTRQSILLEKNVREKTYELSEKNKLLKTHSDHLNEANQLLIDRQSQLQRQSEELKQQSDRLIEINKELQKYNVTKDKLFSIIAHDLISPFNTIIGFSEILKSRYDQMETEEIKKYIDIVNTSSERVYSLLHSLLLWSRSQTNRISYNPEKVKIKPVIKEAMQLSSGNLKSKHIRTEIDCPLTATVWADIEMFKVIIRNILNNAIKFTPQRGLIRFEVKTAADKTQITVIDNGIGMLQTKIDELLSATIISSEQGTDGEAGSGLGITLCRDFIRKNHGELSIASEIGKGSTFTITLPGSRHDR